MPSSRRSVSRRTSRLRISPARAALAALGLAVGAAALGVPALGQDRQERDAPESLLPEGFGDPDPAPAVTDDPAARGPTPLMPPATGPAATTPAPGVPLTTPAADDDEDDKTPEELAAELAAALAKFDMPAAARRDPDLAGVIGADSGGIGEGGYGRASGRFVSRVMRATDAPIASRWLSIALRRALMSRTRTPRGVNGPDFAAERAWLLVRMGEATPAQSLVQSVDTDRYTPKLYEVAMQTALARGDPGSLCPIADAAAAESAAPGWDLIRAMCAGLVSDPGTAGALIDTARRQRHATGIDLLLAEKVTGAGANGRRSVTIEWDGVDRLTSWRYGLATATNVPIPAALFDTVGRHVRAWQSQAPMADGMVRAAAGAVAATLGVLSNIAYVDLIAEAATAEEATPAETERAETLQRAYAGIDAGDRMTALRELWGDSAGDARFAGLVLTARAAGRIPPADTRAGDADRLIASMLTAGLDSQALRWSGIVERGGDGWAMLALANPSPAAPIDYGAWNGVADRDPRKGALLLAGLAGLGRMSVEDAERASSTIGAGLGTVNSWTHAIDAAAARGEPGTVLVLAAAGMQTSDWRGVPAAALFHIVSALRRVGMEGEARMIAAEAIART